MPDGRGAPTPLFQFYRLATRALLPLAFRSVARKLRSHKVAGDRIRERLGHATLPRPAGNLIWFHAASVGESLSVLSLISRMAERLPANDFLITSGTATSAKLIEKRMPARTRHQFAPLDADGPVKRFLAHWRPDAAIFVESELWPVMLAEARGRGARLALLNARLSPKSVRGWTKFPKTARYVLGGFSVMLTQNRTATEHLLMMGADPDRVETGINIKSTSDPLPIDNRTLADLTAALNGRPVWVASSTHPGEEEVVLAAHKQLLRRHANLCLILVPRHPERGGEVAELIASTGLNMKRRSAGEWPDDATQVYLADTLGETGTWYAAAPIVFLGGSLLPIGGHNPYEPANAGAAILTGPHVTNFGESFDPLMSLGGALRVSDANDLAGAVDTWLTDADRLVSARTAARKFSTRRRASLDKVIDTLCSGLQLGGPEKS